MHKVHVYRNKTSKYEVIDMECISMIKDALSVVQPGDKVVIKPNFVRQCSLESKEWEAVITNPVLIRETITACLENLSKEGNESGEIIILDAPQEDSDFKAIVKNIGLAQIVDEIQKTTSIPIHFYDIRIERKITCNGIIVRRIKQVGDPKGYKTVEMGQESCYANKENKDYYGADYDRSEAKKYHNEKSNSYVISGSVLDCDVFINMPKWKTHKIGGMTCCLKNAIGIIGVKNCIPHHTLGSPETKGDAYPEMNQKAKTETNLKKFAHKILSMKLPVVGYLVAGAKYALSPLQGKPMQTIRSGHWYGNDTLWRSILDLNRIIFYADKNGIMQNTQQRKYVAIIDGIIAGEKNGPMMPIAKKCGIVAVAFSPVVGDMAMSRLMGFDYKKIPSIYQGFSLRRYRIDGGIDEVEAEIESNVKSWNDRIVQIPLNETFCFEPAYGWERHIEL